MLSLHGPAAMRGEQVPLSQHGTHVLTNHLLAVAWLPPGPDLPQDLLLAVPNASCCLPCVVAMGTSWLTCNSCLQAGAHGDSICMLFTLMLPTSCLLLHSAAAFATALAASLAAGAACHWYSLAAPAHNCRQRHRNICRLSAEHDSAKGNALLTHRGADLADGRQPSLEHRAMKLLLQQHQTVGGLKNP